MRFRICIFSCIVGKSNRTTAGIVSQLYQPISLSHVVFDIIRKENIFNDTYISGLLTDFNGLFSSECEIKALIFGVPLTKKEVGSRPLSKLTQDILSEFLYV